MKTQILTVSAAAAVLLTGSLTQKSPETSPAASTALQDVVYMPVEASFPYIPGSNNRNASLGLDALPGVYPANYVIVLTDPAPLSPLEFQSAAYALPQSPDLFPMQINGTNSYGQYTASVLPLPELSEAFMPQNIRVTPTPGSLLLLGVAGIALAAGRRR